MNILIGGNIVCNFDQFVSHASQRGQKISFDPRSRIGGPNFWSIFAWHLNGFLKQWHYSWRYCKGSGHEYV